MRKILLNFESSDNNTNDKAFLCSSLSQLVVFFVRKMIKTESERKTWRKIQKILLFLFTCMHCSGFSYVSITSYPIFSFVAFSYTSLIIMIKIIIIFVPRARTYTQHQKRESTKQRARDKQKVPRKHFNTSTVTTGNK